MLVSLRAGGVGLNLIGGNHLFLLDMHWYDHYFPYAYISSACKDVCNLLVANNIIAQNKWCWAHQTMPYATLQGAATW